MKSRAAFTMLELIVVLAILGILASIFIPYARAVRESNNRAKCADNLRQIQQAIQLYGQSNGNAYPSVKQADGNPGFVSYTGAAGPGPFEQGTKVLDNDVTASLWLLVRFKLVEPKTFVCPSSSATPQKELSAANFTSYEHLSYSYATPFSILPDYKLNSDRLRPEFAVLADMNPGIGDGDDITGVTAGASPIVRSRANSRNHKKAGQNVLFGNGLVDFETSAYCGWGGDNIYTTLRGTPIPSTEKPDPSEAGVYSIQVGPSWYSDSYLVPAYNGPR